MPGMDKLSEGFSPAPSLIGLGRVGVQPPLNLLSEEFSLTPSLLNRARAGRFSNPLFILRRDWCEVPMEFKPEGGDQRLMENMYDQKRTSRRIDKRPACATQGEPREAEEAPTPQNLRSTQHL